MHTISTPQPSTASAAQATQSTPHPGRLVVDAPMRMFHWLFALSFVGAYLSADSERWRLLHLTLGYTLAGLLAFRLLYGLLGPRPVRLTALRRRLNGLGAWLQSLAQLRPLGQAHWRQGQNLLTALAVVSLLVLVVPLTLTGYASEHSWSDFLGGDWVNALHEWLGEAMLVIVLLHLALITGLSLLRRKNQALPMLTGRLPGAGPDLVQKNRRWLAAALLLAVLAYGAWEWQQSPQGLIPTKSINHALSDNSDKD
jgi:cytochrome b